MAESLFENRPRLLLIDGHAVLYRAYHAFPDLLSPDGQLVNAAFGFARILLKSLRDFTPEYAAIAFDTKGPTFRTHEYPEYKAHRPPTPQEFIDQVPIAKEFITQMQIPQFALSEYEADDVIGTIARKVEHDCDEQVLTTIVTGDKDILQLVNEHTHVWLPGSKYSKDTEYDRAGVIKKMSVAPEQIADLKGLMGDASDNIPGVKGVGVKTAVKLIEQYESVAGVYAGLDDLELNQDPSAHPLFKGALLKKLLRDREQAFLSQKLATIKVDVPLEFDLEACRLATFDKSKVIELLEKYGFASLEKLLPRDEFELAVQGALF